MFILLCCNLNPPKPTHTFSCNQTWNLFYIFLSLYFLVKFRTFHTFSLLAEIMHSLSNMSLFSNQIWNLTHTFSLAFEFRTSLIPLSCNWTWNIFFRSLFLSLLIDLEPTIFPPWSNPWVVELFLNYRLNMGSLFEFIHMFFLWTHLCDPCVLWMMFLFHMC